VDKAISRDALYFPGSTFKLITTAAALAQPARGTAVCAGYNRQPLTWRYAGTTYRRPPGRIRDFSGSGHGTLDLENNIDRALTVSCNVFFATLAAHLGADTMHDTMQKAELSAVPPVKRLAAYLPEAGFGQVTVKTSPIEMAMIAAAAGVAAPGSESSAGAARPYWVDQVVDGARRSRPDSGTGAASSQPYRPFEPT